MQISNNLGSFNRFVTLLFHGDWLFLFLFLFLSIEYSRRSHRLTNRLADRRNLKSVLPVKWKVRIRGSWQKQLFANEKKNFYRHAKLFYPRSSTKRTFPRNVLKNSLSLILSFHVFRTFPHTLSLFLLLAHITVFSLRYKGCLKINARFEFAVIFA